MRRGTGRFGKRWIVAISTLILLLPGFLLAADGIYRVSDFGAVPDGATVNSLPIQNAVDAAYAAGGGVVFFGPGEWLSGTIRLRSNVTLELAAGATLLGSTNLADYPEIRPEYRSYTDRYTVRSLIYAENETNVGLRGKGKIDGQGSKFEGSLGGYAGRKEYYVRPYMIRFITCSDVTVEDLTLTNSAMWLQHYLACDRVRVDGITVFNHANYNNDMIDIDGCRDVIISNCIGDTDDDAMTLKSTHGRPCENVTITNCILSSHCNALKFGTESIGGFKNITVSNIVIAPSKHREKLYGHLDGISGISLECVDGGTFEGVLIDNVRIVGPLVPLFMRLGGRGRVPVDGMEKPAAGVFRDVMISRVSAVCAGNIGCAISGIPEHYIEDVTLRDLRFEFPGGGTEEMSKLPVEELADKYPECTMFGELPAYGIYARHVRGLTMDNVELRTQEKDARPAVVFEDVEGYRYQNLLPDTKPKVRR